MNSNITQFYYTVIKNFPPSTLCLCCFAQHSEYSRWWKQLQEDFLSVYFKLQNLSNLHPSNICGDRLFQLRTSRRHCKRRPACSRSVEIRLPFACITLLHVVSRPIYDGPVLHAKSSVVRNISEMVGRGCVIFPKSQVDEGETAPRKHDCAVLAFMASFMSLGVRVMLLRLKGEHSLQG